MEGLFDASESSIIVRINRQEYYNYAQTPSVGQTVGIGSREYLVLTMHDSLISNCMGFNRLMHNCEAL